MTYALVGRRFGKLLVIARDRPRGAGKDILWLCVCKCRRMRYVATGTLLRSKNNTHRKCTGPYYSAG